MRDLMLMQFTEPMRGVNRIAERVKKILDNSYWFMAYAIYLAMKAYKR